MGKYFKIDGKVVRAALTKGEFQDFLLIIKEISNRKQFTYLIAIH